MVEYPSHDAAIVHWEGDSLDVIREFPASVRRKLGQEIQRLQLGEAPLDSRSTAAR
ncbi:hypothetical protein Pla175_12020 [Pirellulimonas nuda]|uniref:Uncharacterized protein n=1 Tax=Pirellulimonas nuda TaxID=2528009 RepID=A0A518D8N4_9BACT|nr:hypothetical protein Pla175_12020 [Pirellulimonas nuda]